MKKLLLIFLFLIVFPAMASHIVGGEFELLYISANKYRLNMVLYFDVIHGSKGAHDATVTASIYRKVDNVHMTDVIIPFSDSVRVGYTKPECSHGELVTTKINYSTVITLGNEYNSPEGYYISWQRCCRNYSITNIFSDPTGVTAGQTFYLEFPPVVKNGLPFINSSPRLFPPLNDYACPGRNYYVNFAGVDDDNDSIVYSLVTPLNTTTSDAFPAEAPGPYPLVTYRAPFSQTNIIGGNPDLRISLDGFLTCTPVTTGLFVFAVRVQQFRSGVQIGESRRDFQMLVTDSCEPDAAPVIAGRKLTDATFGYLNTMAVTFDNNVTDDNRCIEIEVSDSDSKDAAHNFQENISIKMIPIGFFDDDLASLLPSVTSATLINGSVKDFRICFPQCPPVKSGTFKIGVIAFDDACSLPRSDTLFITVTVIPPTNSSPYFTAPTPLPITATLQEADAMTWPFTIVDPDLDSMDVQAFTDGFDLASAGMKFAITTNKKGLVAGTFTWDAYCDIYDFTQRTKFKVTIIANDFDPCNFSDPVSAVFNLTVKLPGVADVFIDTDITPDPHEQTLVSVETQIYESVRFKVTGTQADNDLIVLGVSGDGFQLKDYAMSYPLTSGGGLASSEFEWDIACTTVSLAAKNLFDLYFTVLDNTNKCRVPKWDSVHVQIHVLPPVSHAATFTMVSLNDLTISNSSISTLVGDPIAVSLIGTDNGTPPVDSKMELTLISATGNVEPKGYTFTPSSGPNSVLSQFTWQPECSIFQNGVYTNDYNFKFLLSNKECIAMEADTLSLDLTIKDIDAGSNPFNPFNVITPNGDDCNDYLAMEGLDDDVEAVEHCNRVGGIDAIIGLPVDNCAGRFQSITIYNRWGKSVFESADRKFRWYATDCPAGVYFYTIEFGNRKFKGSVSVRP